MSLHPSLALSLCLAACAGSPPPAAAPTPPAAEAPKPDTAPFDRMFIDMMVPHHQGAVEMAHIALERAEHPELKVMAQAIVSSQEAEIARMKGWRNAWFGSEDTPPMGGAMDPGMPDMPGMGGMTDMPRMVEGLKTASPFDLAFIDAMIPHHQEAVRMAGEATTKAGHAEINELAASILRDQQKEIAQLQEWRTAWYPNAPTAMPGMAH
jgi:uncharacterized protein (DUF305 family)